MPSKEEYANMTEEQKNIILERNNKWRENNKEAYAISQRNYRKRNKEKIASLKKTQYEENKHVVLLAAKIIYYLRKALMPNTLAESGSRQQRKTLYKMTPEQLDQMWSEQGGVCKMCSLPTNKLCVDHDHNCCPGKASCGKCIRGILCHTCNIALGVYEKHKSNCEDYLINFLRKRDTRSI